MKKTQTAEHNGEDEAANEPNVLYFATSMYADLRTTGLTREDILSLLCGLLFVAVTDKPRKRKREKTAKRGMSAVAGSSSRAPQ